jgi:hypothetical protein
MLTIISVPMWMRQVWASEGHNPRTGLPMTEAEQKQIEDIDGSIYEDGEKSIG